jgi:predicted transcriptional regulator
MAMEDKLSNKNKAILFMEKNGSATSEEIQGVIGGTLGYASNTLRKLHVWGKVSRRPFHVTNNRGFKYFLTKDGIKKAEWLHSIGY